MPEKTPGKVCKHPANVIRGVHVGRIEAGDHRIEACLLFFRQRPVRHRNVSVGEGVVVERCVRLQVVGRSKVAGILVRPFLLQGDAEQRHSSDLGAHDLQKVVDVGAFLNVVGQMKVGVVQFKLV